MTGQSALTFPCRFPIKVMGENSDGFLEEIVVLARRHIPDLGEGAVSTTPSRTAKYLSVTITFTARSRDQLDNLYRAMHAHPKVRMVL
ncbi:MAG TPA: DUF493 domain-containing protein [Mariprofundaceae bacterium]|nr:DUF493 domain-containing protein [Mariprofundaceae bacterium]